MRILCLTFLVVLTMAWPAWAQGTKPKTLDELVSYTGPDRQKIITEGAKAEGKVVWYTSLSGNYREIVDAFKKKYPEIQVEVYRAGSSDVTERLLNEGRAGRYLADAMETTPGSLMLLRENGILKPYASPELAKYPEEAKTKADGSRVYWVTDREAYLGFGYNTRMISSAQVPKTFQDLLRPDLKGKLAVTTESSSARVIGSMLKYKGDGFMKKLKDQEVKLFKLASLGFLNLLIAGEIAGSPTIFRNQVVVMKEKGAPIDWVPLDVVVANAGGSAIIANAPHPHAALLLTDFVIGAEGQKLMEQFRYGIAWKEYPFKREYPERGMTTAQYQDAEEKWSQLLRSITQR
ncbi:MAG TPA: extracellular solute-binding protein [Candidatus Binatia bacterium]|jgi:iron(III) transport system substrate-binding protein|nr:extracellular solute-binding protein [Candidatus Binatia bacterium]